jgi:hypothetical protein
LYSAAQEAVTQQENKNQYLEIKVIAHCKLLPSKTLWLWVFEICFPTFGQMGAGGAF